MTRKNLYIISGCNGAGIRNLFRLFMNEVDYWDIYDNSFHPRQLIASGGRGADTEIYVSTTFNTLQNYVR